MNRSPRELALGAGAILVAALFLGDRYVVGPLLDRWSTATTAERDARNTLTQADMMGLQLPVLRGDWDETRKRLRAGEGDPAQTLIGHIQEACKAAGVTARDVRSITTEGRGEIRELIFEMKAETKLEQLTKLLFELANLERPVRVASLSVRTDPRRKGELNVDLRLAALILVELEKEQS